MKIITACIIIFLSVSCTSRSQEQKGISNNLTNDSAAILTSRSSSDTLSLLFVGDIMQHQSQIDAARTLSGYDYSSCFAHIKPLIKDFDLILGNLEVTFAGKPYRGYPAFSAPDEYLQSIKDIGFDVLFTANNHCLDRGRKGFKRTIHLLDSMGIKQTGTFLNPEARKLNYPLLIEKKGIRMAFLNYTYATNGVTIAPPYIVNYIDTTIIAKDIQKAREMKPNVIIACMHWGNEYQSLPTLEQIKLSKWLIKKGVNHIIGGHPHVIQPIEVRTDSTTQEKHLVAYSLGNFISNMSKRGTDGGVLLRLQLVKDTTVHLAHADYTFVITTRPVQNTKKKHILYPINRSIDSIPINARNSLKIFKEDSRKLFRKHNKGINEHIFF